MGGATGDHHGTSSENNSKEIYFLRVVSCLMICFLLVVSFPSVCTPSLISLQRRYLSDHH